MNLELFQELPTGAVVQNEHLFKRLDLWKKLGLEIIRDSFTYTFFFFKKHKFKKHEAQNAEILRNI